MKFSERLKKLHYLIGTDLFRYTGELSFQSFMSTYIREPGFNFLFWLRVRSLFQSKIVGYILHRKRIRFGIDIRSMQIGEGFYIGHYGHIVVNGNASIGNNCNISQGVTIGVINTGSKQGTPVIGNHVYIAPGAKIIGNIRIGNNVAIGANSVITNDLPDNAVVAGIPARILSYDGSTGYINNVMNVTPAL